MNVSVNYNTSLRRLVPFSPNELKDILRRMCLVIKQLCPYFSPNVELVLTSDAAIEDLNQLYLGATGPTNTLAFPAHSSVSKAEKYDKQTLASGLIYVSIETFDREAMLYGQERKEYFLHLLSHAAAHLADYDHGPEMDTLTEALEAEIEDFWLAENF